eukprot:6474024-Amphidinium_carterae.2
MLSIKEVGEDHHHIVREVLLVGNFTKEISRYIEVVQEAVDEHISAGHDVLKLGNIKEKCANSLDSQQHKTLIATNV